MSIVSGSTLDVFVTTAVKVTSPLSCTTVGFAVFVTLIAGFTSVSAMIASLLEVGPCVVPS